MQVSSSIKQQLEKHHQESFGWSMCCCYRNEEHAKEVLQIAYLKVLEGKARFKQQSNFKTWLFSIIRNTAIDWHRKRNRERKTYSLTQASEKVTEASPQDEIIAKELNAIIQDAIQRLPGRQFEVLQLVFYHNLTIEQAAKVMNISLGSARTHYKRGKAQLKTWLKCRKAEWQ